MDIEDFVSQCESIAIQSSELRQTLQPKTTEVSDTFKEILTYKTINNECVDKTNLVNEIQAEKEKTEVETIRAKQQKTKESTRHERYDQIIRNFLRSNQQGVSDKDEQVMYKNQLKNYLIRRITGVNLNMDEMSSSGNVSGWITKLRLPSFQVFEWSKGEKSDSEAKQILWDLSAKMDIESYQSWNQKGLFGDD